MTSYRVDRGKRRRTGLVMIALSGVVLAGGCGGGGDGGENPTGAGSPAKTQGKPKSGGGGGVNLQTLNACTLLTSGELQAAVGTAPADAGTSKNVGASHSCTWQLPQGSYFLLQVLVYAGPSTARAGYESIAGTLGRGGTPVTGVGEKAVFKTGRSLGSNTADLYVLSGGTSLALHHDSEGTTSSQAQLSQLATKALDRMK